MKIINKKMLGPSFACILVGCSTPGENLQAVVDELKFAEGEEGCVRANAAIDLAAGPFAEANANIVLIKQQGDNPPDC